MDGKNQNLKIMGISAQQIFDEIEALNLPTLTDDREKNVAICGEFYQQCCNMDPGFSILELSHSRLVRLKGEILNRVYNIEPSKRSESLLKHGEWGEFKKKYVTQKDAAIENYRKIAARFPHSDRSADGLTVTKMLSTIEDENPTRKPMGDKKTNFASLEERIFSNLSKYINELTVESVKGSRLFAEKMRKQLESLEHRIEEVENDTVSGEQAETKQTFPVAIAC